VLFDTWVHPLMMGLEEHLIGMFRGDSEFHEDAAPSHLGGVRRELRAAPAQPADAAPVETDAPSPAPATPSDPTAAAWVATWQADAERELKKIPFFVRGKARRNTERYAAEKQLATITVDTLYDAKAHFSR
jgi:light-independent protochlorophyllide reductase subunit B